jgi:hypothetical protein
MAREAGVERHDGARERQDGRWHGNLAMASLAGCWQPALLGSSPVHLGYHPCWPNGEEAAPRASVISPQGANETAWNGAGDPGRGPPWNISSCSPARPGVRGDGGGTGATRVHKTT